MRDPCMEEITTTINLDYKYAPRERDWRAHPSLDRIRSWLTANLERYERLLHQIANAAGAEFDRIAPDSDPFGTEPFWNNGWFPPLDAISLSGLLVINNPLRYVEVGSGSSTKFARWAVDRFNLRTQIISIDPQPRAEIDNLCDELIRKPFEDIPSTFFQTLSKEDIFFIDNSHRSFPNSDVTVFFMEVLPTLPRGMVFGLHDIFLPYDYSDVWRNRFYNEQYLLAAYLFGGSDGGSILLPVHYLERDNANMSAGLFKSFVAKNIHLNGAAFWMVR